jgi:glycosyltransferase involved in cell wall biosynthesis
MNTTQPFRVVHVIPHLRGAPGRYVADIAVEQHRRWPGLVAIVLSQDLEEPWTTSPELVTECRESGVAVFWCGEFFRRDAVLLPWAARAIREMVLAGQPWASDAVVHAHTAMAAVVGRKALAPKVVLTLHGVGRNRPADYDLQDDLACMLCDAVLVPSAQMASRLRDTRALERVSVVRPAIHLDRADPVRDVRTGRRIVHAGPLIQEHQPALLIEAMPVVWERVPDAELHIFGQGELAMMLRDRAQAVDPGGRRIVVCTDADDTTDAALGRFDAFASASMADHPTDGALIAMAAGLPIVATRTSGLAEFVELARCGLVAPHATPRDLGLAMAVLIETGPHGRDELGALGREFATESLGLDAHLAALDTIYGPPSTLERQVRWAAPDGPVRLHLGSGDERRPGWLNVDVRAEAMPDLVARVDALPMVPDASVDEIEACHLFEHLSLHEAHKALREWARVLKPGGRLFLELPNFDACVRMLGQARDQPGYDFGMFGIFGWPPEVERDGDALAHRWGWTPETLTAALEAAGFEQVECLPVTQTYRPATKYDRDFRVGAARARVAPEGG